MGATRSRTMWGPRDRVLAQTLLHPLRLPRRRRWLGCTRVWPPQVDCDVPMWDPNVRVLPYALSFTSASSTTPQTRPTRCTFTTCYSLSPLLCPWRLHGAIDTSICERGFSLMNLLKTAKRSRMGNELVPIAHADGRVQPGQRRGLERPYIPKSPWMPSLSCGAGEQSSHGRYSNNNEFFSSLESLLEASGDT